MDFKQIITEGIYTHQDLTADLVKLANFPIVEVVTIGRSVEGRNLYAVRLGHGANQIHYTAGLHANEWLTTPLLVAFCFIFCETWQQQGLCLGYNLAKIGEDTSIWLTPAMNPDGAWLVQKGIAKENPRYQEIININGGSTDFRRWKANIKGVDLNHQFPAAWSKQAAVSPQSPAPRDHAGPYALSEPEAKALADFTLAQDFVRVLAFHAQGELIFWGYCGLEPPAAEAMVKTMAKLSGYRAVRYAGTHAGYKDWFIQDWHRPGFTVEMGCGNNPLPPAVLPKIFTRLLKMLLWCAEV